MPFFMFVFFGSGCKLVRRFPYAIPRSNANHVYYVESHILSRSSLKFQLHDKINKVSGILYIWKVANWSAVAENMIDLENSSKRSQIDGMYRGCFGFLFSFKLYLTLSTLTLSIAPLSSWQTSRFSGTEWCFLLTQIRFFCIESTEIYTQ